MTSTTLIISGIDYEEKGFVHQYTTFNPYESQVKRIGENFITWPSIRQKALINKARQEIKKGNDIIFFAKGYSEKPFIEAVSDSENLPWDDKIFIVKNKKDETEMLYESFIRPGVKHKIYY